MYEMTMRNGLRLKSFEVQSSYDGVMEGSPETATRHILEKLAKQYPAEPLNSGHALVVPAGSRLPKWICKARLGGPPAVDRSADEGVLELCWFVDSLETPVFELIEAALDQVRWSERAKDVEFF